MVVELIHPSSNLKLPDNIQSHKFYSDQFLWYKENLLNVGINILIEGGYENIAWLDADIVFEDSYWIQDTIESLRHHNLCQIFSRAYELNKLKHNFRDGCVRYWKSTGNLLPIDTLYHTGYAWACKASILKECKLYDKCLLGGADSLIWLSSFNGVVGNFFELLKSHPFYLLGLDGFFNDFQKWSKLWGSLIDGNVGHIYCPIDVLPHGLSKGRQYISRYQYLIDSKYNPNNDTFYKEGIIFSSNEKLKSFGKKYFSLRKEDKKSLGQNLEIANSSKILNYLNRKFNINN